MRFAAVLFCFIACSALAVADEHPSEQTLHAFLIESRNPQRGDVFSQAALDGVDYPSLLRGAVARRRGSLVALFRYTATGRLMGEGAVSHASILADLLEHWGDEQFAVVLQPLSGRVRRAVAATLSEHFSPAVFARRFPHTYALSIHAPPA